MSFSLSKTGKKSEVEQYIAQAHAPAAVKDFLLDAVVPYPDDAEISLTAYGHVASSATDQSNASIIVRRVPPGDV